MKVQVLYPIYNIDKNDIKRLNLSIKTLKQQNTKHEVEICIVDGSLYPTNLKEIEYDFKYYHEYCGSIVCRARIINKGFENLIDQDLFFYSDIDLLYPPDYIDYMLKIRGESNGIVFYPVVRTATYPYGEYEYGCSIDGKEAKAIEKEVLGNGKFDEYISKKKLMLQGNLIESFFDKKLYSTPAILFSSYFFRLVKGYDENMYGLSKEDREFTYRTSFLTNIKMAQVYNKNAYVYHLYHAHKQKDFNGRGNKEILQYKVNNINSKEDALLQNNNSCIKGVEDIFLCSRNLAYLPNPKSGTDTLKASMLEYCETMPYHLINKLTYFLNKNMSLNISRIPPDFYDDSKIAFENPKDYFSFTFVRHPFDRFLSFYYQKIKKMHNLIFNTGNTILYDMGFREDMNPIEVLNLIEYYFEYKPQKVESHFRRQTDIIYKSGEQVVDYIGKLENFEEDLNNLNEKANSNLRLLHLNKSFKEENVDSYYDDTTLREKVYEIYKKDYEILGYEK